MKMLQGGKAARGEATTQAKQSKTKHSKCWPTEAAGCDMPHWINLRPVAALAIAVESTKNDAQ